MKRVLHTAQGDLTKYYIYDGERPILEYRVNGDMRGRDLYGKGVDEILMGATIRHSLPSPSPAPDLRTFYYQQDHQGSVTHLTDGDGNVFEKYRYDVFGTPTIRDGNNQLLTEGSAVSNRFMFTGREYAAAFKFYEYRARAYNPTLGRFMSEVPEALCAPSGIGKAPMIGRSERIPRKLNLIRSGTAGTIPIDFTDPTGLMPDALVAEPAEGRDVAPAVVLGHAAIIGVLAAPAAEAAVGRAAVAAISRSPTLARLVGAIAADVQSTTGRNWRRSDSSTAAKNGEVVFWSGTSRKQTEPQRKLLRALRGKRPWR